MPETTKIHLAASKLPTVFLCGFLHLATITFTLLQGCPEAFYIWLESGFLEAASKHQVLQPPENLAKTAPGEEIKGDSSARSKVLEFYPFSKNVQALAGTNLLPLGPALNKSFLSSVFE